MDLDVFDDVARQAADGSSRRSLVRAGLGALGLTGLGLAVTAGEVDAGKNKKKRKRRKKRCKSKERPVKCGKGCCAAEFPNCCSMFQVPSGTAGSRTCAPASYSCCPVEAGGGACPPNTTCCPVTQYSLLQQLGYGWCAVPGFTCCPADSTGTACPADALCSVNNACPDPDTYFINAFDGCCYLNTLREGEPGVTPRLVIPAD